MWIDTKGSTVLSVPECKQLLAVAAKDGRIGRLGVPTDGAPVVVPVNFALQDGHVLVRVGTGFLSAAASGRLVAFEVDHADPAAAEAWSVLVRGLATLVRSPSDAQIAAVDPLVPDPGEMVLTIRLDTVTGRHFTICHHRDPSPC